jgi:hypothetical protein
VCRWFPRSLCSRAERTTRIRPLPGIRINSRIDRTDRKDRIGKTDRRDRIDRTDRRDRTDKTGRRDRIDRIGKTDLYGITADRTTGVKTAAADRMAAATADLRAADPITDSIKEEGARVQMADLRETDKTDFRETAGRVLKTVRMIAVVRALVQAAVVVLMAVREIIEETADREPDPEIREAARALWEKLRQRIWKRGAKKISAVQAIKRGISAQGKTIFTRRMKHYGISPAGSSSPKRKRKKWLKK